MRILIAPDSFKGSMSALDAAHAIRLGVLDAAPDAETAIIPLADGGEGTVAAMVSAVPGSSLRWCLVTGPLGNSVCAHYGLLGPSGRCAVVEMASASGLTLVAPDRLDPGRSTSYGTGELIRHAVSNDHVEKLIIGLGGSATNDGGVGALAALGVEFFDEHGGIVSGYLSPMDLPRIASANADKAYPIEAEIVIACDVTNPLVGPYGASAVFGPQKGADGRLVARLDGLMRDFGRIVDGIGNSRRSDRTVANESFLTRAGGGAAGGLAAGLLALYPTAAIRPGIDLVLDAANINAQIESADLVITGEGKLDTQTLSGKAICGLLARTKARGKRTIAIGGAVDEAALSSLHAIGLAQARGLVDIARSLEDAMTRAPQLLREVARRMLVDEVSLA